MRGARASTEKAGRAASVRERGFGASGRRAVPFVRGDIDVRMPAFADRGDLAACNRSAQA
jgi:hypothetical protein